jgi:hypothetical protein
MSDREEEGMERELILFSRFELRGSSGFFKAWEVRGFLYPEKPGHTFVLIQAGEGAPAYSVLVSHVREVHSLSGSVANITRVVELEFTPPPPA